MYYQYFGLDEAPFSIAVNPRYLYMSPRHRDALAHLLYGVGAGGGFILLTGEVGTGKTTINRCLIEQLPDNADLAIVLNPALDSRDLLATVCEELGVLPDTGRPGLKDLTDALHRFLLENHRARRKTVLMIDEAQHLDFDVLEQIRLLTNLETNEEKLLHIILIGQPELAHKLARPELRQLNQRITARFELAPLTRAETAAYIRHRLAVAGAPAGGEIFPVSLMSAIHRESRGVPRLINLLCDRMLLGAYGQNRGRVDRSLLASAVREVTGSAESTRPGQGMRGSLWRWVVIGCFASALTVLAILASVGLWSSPESTAPPSSEATLSPSPVIAPDESVREAPLPAPAIAKAAAWRLTMPEGVRALATLYGAAPPVTGGDPCAGWSDPDLRCTRLDAASWNTLVESGRPALLALLDAQRFERRALFLGLDAGEYVLLGSPAGIERVPVATVSNEWTGLAWQLWRRPDGMSRVLQAGDRGPDVARLAELFATLDQQPRPLSTDRFDPGLEARLRLFQRRHGLEDDGVMGEQTLRVLAQAAGEDLSLAAARRQVEEGALVR